MYFGVNLLSRARENFIFLFEKKMFLVTHARALLQAQPKVCSSAQSFTKIWFILSLNN